MIEKFPAIIFLVFGITFIVLNKRVLSAIHWVDKKIWNKKRREQFPGFGGKEYKPWMVILLGICAVISAIFFWFVL